jgi:hypothetical protein
VMRKVGSQVQPNSQIFHPPRNLNLKGVVSGIGGCDDRWSSRRGGCHQSGAVFAVD